MPFCPACGVRVAGGATRCRLDGSILRKLQCPACQGEVSPGDHFCGHCRHSLVQSPAHSSPLNMCPAPRARRFGAFVFDALAWVLLAQCFWELPAWLLLLALPLWVCLWEAGDVATPGQQVFSLKRLGLKGENLVWRQTSACLVAACLPWRVGSTRLYWLPT